MTAIGCALALGFGLAYLGWRDWLKFKQPVPPHEELKRTVSKLGERVQALEMAANGRRFGGE